MAEPVRAATAGAACACRPDVAVFRPCEVIGLDVTEMDLRRSPLIEPEVCVMRWLRIAVPVAAFAVLVGCAQEKKAAAPMSTEPHVMASDEVAAGRYIVRIAGCNDCHTPGFLENGEAVPEDQWLIGMPLGFRGPWGTTYPRNLRIKVSEVTADEFVAELKSRNTKPPMPWPSLHAMSDADLRAVYAYIKTLTPVGEQTPEYVPPDVEPTTPYFLFVPQMPAGAAPPAQ